MHIQAGWRRSLAALVVCSLCSFSSSSGLSNSMGPPPAKDGGLINQWYGSNPQGSLVDLTGYTSDRLPEWPEGLRIGIYHTSPHNGLESVFDSIEADVREFWDAVTSKREWQLIEVGSLNRRTGALVSASSAMASLTGEANVIVRISPYFVERMHISNQLLGGRERQSSDVLAGLQWWIREDAARDILGYSEVAPVDADISYNVERAFDLVSRESVREQNPIAFVKHLSEPFLKDTKDNFAYHFVYNPMRQVSCSAYVFEIGNKAQFALIDISVGNVVELYDGKYRISAKYKDVFFEESLQRCVYNTASAVFGFVVNPDMRSSEGRQEALRAISLENPFSIQ